MVRSREEKDYEVPAYQTPDYVAQDYNGLWFVLNHDGFPVSPAFATEIEALVWIGNTI